jgi:Protein of unknown function (DUF3164).
MSESMKLEAIDGVVTIEGKRYYQNEDGALIPESLVKPADKLEDDSVRKMIGFAQDISDQITRFKEHSFEDFFTAVSLINEKYGVTKGGKRGNITMQTLDGLMKVQVKVAEVKQFGPQLGAAKQLIDDCIAGWVEGSRDEIQMLVNRAFDIQKEGKINHSALFQLLRYEISDPRWQEAMKALADAIRVTGNRTYIQFYRRTTINDEWRAITVNLAKA